MTNPTPDQIITARTNAGLTQKEAAALIYATERAWNSWESESESKRRMPPGLFELFLIKTGQTKGQEMANGDTNIFISDLNEKLSKGGTQFNQIKIDKNKTIITITFLNKGKGIFYQEIDIGNNDDLSIAINNIQGIVKYNMVESS